MALARYVITATVTIPAGTPGMAAFPQTFHAGTPIVLDNASPLCTYLNGQGALRPYQQGTDVVSHAAISN